MNIQDKLDLLIQEEKRYIENNISESRKEKHQEKIYMLERYKILIGHMDWDAFEQLIKYLASEALGCDCWD